MASVCGSTLALMDTGVPIKAPVAGIAMGLIKEGERYAILTDIQGMKTIWAIWISRSPEPKGVTALQMDIKIKGITPEIMSKALEQARKARLFILDKILEIIPVPRTELKSFAPRITVLTSRADKIGAIIGPGGKIIRTYRKRPNQDRYRR